MAVPRQRVFGLAPIFCAAMIALSSRVEAATSLDNTRWQSSECHFNEITFFSATGANLNFKEDESMLGWNELFNVDEARHMVTLVPDKSPDDDNDSFTGTYVLAGSPTSSTLVGSHSWSDETGHHEERCLYTFKGKF